MNKKLKIKYCPAGKNTKDSHIKEFAPDKDTADFLDSALPENTNGSSETTFKALKDFFKSL